MSDTETLIRAAGLSLAAVFIGPRFHARLYPGGALALSGEPVRSFNQMILGPGGDPAEAMAEAVAAARARGLPLLVLTAAEIAEVAAPAADDLGLERIGAMPLMALDVAGPLDVSGRCDVTRVLTAEDVGQATAMVASAFELPLDLTQTFITVCADQVGLAEVYLGRREGQPMGSVTVTRTGSTIGVWNMATPAQFQGKGVGRAVLTQVLERLRQQGAQQFYLIASDAGRPLYESLGFTVTTELTAWGLAAD